MDERQVELIGQAIDLVQKPYVLEVLAALDDGQFDSDAYPDRSALEEAVRHLLGLGAVVTEPRSLTSPRPGVQLTDCGKRLVVDLAAIADHDAEANSYSVA